MVLFVWFIVKISFVKKKNCPDTLKYYTTANKKKVPLKSYSLEIRIDSVNKILKNKEKVE